MRQAILAWVVAPFALTSIAPAQSPEAKPEGTRSEVRIERKAIPFEVRYEFSRQVGRGRLIKVRDGKEGELVQSWRVSFENGKPVGKELVDSQRTEPVHALFHMGQAGFATSRGSFMRHKVLTMHATAYDPSAGRGSRATFRTATGRRAEFGVVAVDPRVIPLHSLLYIEGYGFAIAADRGSAIKGNRIDLCKDSRWEALQFGRRQVRVHILR